MKRQESNKSQKKITQGLFVIYLILLIWIVLMKTEFSFKYLNAIREINLIPFAEPVIVNDKIYFREMYLNALVFMPFGIYISMLNFNWSFGRKIVPIAATSLLFETLQYVFAIGSSDITDFLMNTLGGALGIIIYSIIYKIFKDKLKINKLFNVLASIGTMGFMLLAGILILSNI